MAKDTKIQLDRIQQALLQEDDAPQSPVVPAPEAVDAYNTDNTDVSPQVLSDQLRDEKKHSLTGILILVLLLTLAIVGAIGWFLLRRWGYLQ